MKIILGVALILVGNITYAEAQRLDPTQSYQQQSVQPLGSDQFTGNPNKPMNNSIGRQQMLGVGQATKGVGNQTQGYGAQISGYGAGVNGYNRPAPNCNAYPPDPSCP